MGDNGFFGPTVTAVRARFFGDRHVAQQLLGVGRSIHGKMVDNNTQGHDDIYAQITTETGVVYKVSRCFGIDEIQIYVPPIGGEMNLPETIIILGYIVRAGVDYDYQSKWYDEETSLHPRVSVEMPSGVSTGFDSLLGTSGDDVLIPFSGFPDNDLKYIPLTLELGEVVEPKQDKTFFAHHNELWEYLPDENISGAVDFDTGQPLAFNPAELFNSEFNGYESFFNGNIFADRGVDSIGSPIRSIDKKGFHVYAGVRLGRGSDSGETASIIFTSKGTSEGGYSYVMLPSDGSAGTHYGYAENIPVTRSSASSSDTRFFDVDSTFTIGATVYKFTEAWTLHSDYARTINGKKRDFDIPCTVEGGLHKIAFRTPMHSLSGATVGELLDTLAVELILATDRGFMTRKYLLKKEGEEQEPWRITHEGESLTVSNIFQGLSVMVNREVDIEDFDSLIGIVEAPEINE